MPTTLHAKKSLGQHFLNSPAALAKIIEAARLQKGENVLEIGPGTGILTEALLKTGVHIIAVEKDARAYELLKEKFVAEIKNGNLILVHDDVLKIRIIKRGEFEGDASRRVFGPSEGEGEAGAARARADTGLREASPSNLKINNSSFSIVANIPYYITGAILEKFLEHGPRPNRMVLLVQKEVAERIVAKPEGNKTIGKESILSISVKAFGEPHIVAKVPRGAFVPPPQVDSAILAIENISDKRFAENSVEIKRFFEILKAGFAHKRKFLKSNLELILNNDSKPHNASKQELQEHQSHVNKNQEQSESLDLIWKKLNLNEKVRAEDVALEQWFEIARFLSAREI